MRSMRRRGFALWCALTSAALTAQVVGAPGDASRGKTLYESRCTACHSLDHSRIGPAHRGVYGRRAARVPGFDYSPALRQAHIIWNARSLDRWLKDPEGFVPGQKMGFSVPDPQDRADIIAFLASAEAK